MLKSLKVTWLPAALFEAIKVLLRGSTLRAFRLAPVLCGAVVSGIATATPVFDNTVLPGTTSAGPTCCRIGDEITLAGTSRRIVNISLVVYAQQDEFVQPIEVRIYANDGLDGSPGTVLWDSGTQAYLVTHTGQYSIDFPIPGVLVPDTITVTSWIQAAPFGLDRLVPSGTTVGTFVTPWVEANYLPGAPWLREQPVFAFQVRVDADEPSTAVLTILDVALLFGFGRSRLYRMKPSEVKAPRTLTRSCRETTKARPPSCMWMARWMSSPSSLPMRPHCGRCSTTH